MQAKESFPKSETLPANPPPKFPKKKIINDNDNDDDNDNLFKNTKFFAYAQQLVTKKSHGTQQTKNTEAYAYVL
jgi:hypothetical protein